MGEIRTNIAPKEVNRDEYTPNTNYKSEIKSMKNANSGNIYWGTASKNCFFRKKS